MTLDLGCLLAWLLAGYGLCFFLIHKASHPALLDFVLGSDEKAPCVYCVGFHVGWMTWLARRAFEDLPSPLQAGVECVAWSFAMATACYALDAMLRWFEQESG